MKKIPITTNAKALAINLEKNIYGSFAEIGAGQGVAEYFFKVGRASGTIAKTMSAYDMTYSNLIYGESNRFVSREKLNNMLIKEFRLLTERLSSRSSHTRFFAFANTVETINYKRTNQGHGWIGLRFQLQPETPFNECIIHVLMHDKSNTQQQEVLGIIGVNLLYACFHKHQNPEDLLYSLVDNLDNTRIEIDMFSLSGPDFKFIDNRLLSLKMVKKGISKSAMFGSHGLMEQPAEVLYKKPILLLRGRFRPLTYVNMDMLEKGYKQFVKDVIEQKIKEQNPPMVITELTLYNLKTTEDKKINDQDFLERADLLCSLGHRVLISDYYEYYKVISYLSHINMNQKIGIILGTKNLKNIFDDNYYHNLEGGILESFGQLFSKNVKLYVYPSKSGDKIETIANIKIPRHLKGLYLYLKNNNKIEDITNYDNNILHITSDKVLQLIKKEDHSWEDMVPTQAVEFIKKNKLFNTNGVKRRTSTKIFSYK